MSELYVSASSLRLLQECPRAWSYPDLAMIERAVWDLVQALLQGRRTQGTRDVLRSDQRVDRLSGLMRCGVCRGPMSVIGRQLKNGVEYTQFGCTAHVKRGDSICPNRLTISEKKITDAFLDHMRTEV